MGGIVSLGNMSTNFNCSGASVGQTYNSSEWGLTIRSTGPIGPVSSNVRLQSPY